MVQYFHNRGAERVAETLAALHAIGARHHADLLAGCWAKVKGEPVPRVASLEEYSRLAAERSFTAEDSAYDQERPDVLTLLEAHYSSLLGEWVAVSA